MSRSWKKLIPSGPTIGFLIVVMTAAICCRIAWLAFDAQDLSDIAGYAELKGELDSPEEELVDPPRDILKLLNRADYLGESFALTESEINRYLQMTLSPKQNGIFNLISRIDGVWVRLHDGFVELIIERRIQGYQTIFPHQVSYFIKVQANDDGEIESSFNGGELYAGFAVKAATAGQLNLPELALPLIQQAAMNIGEAYENELEFLLKKSKRVEISQDRVLYVGRGTGKPK